MENNEALTIFNNLGLKNDQIFKKRKNADFVNSIINSNLVDIMKSYYYVPDTNKEIMFWMVRMDLKDKDWENHDYDEIITEEFKGKNFVNDNFNFNLSCPFRIPAVITEIDNERYYEVKGLYKFNSKISTDRKHVFERIS